MLYPPPSALAASSNGNGGGEVRATSPFLAWVRIDDNPEGGMYGRRAKFLGRDV